MKFAKWLMPFSFVAPSPAVTETPVKPDHVQVLEKAADLLKEEGWTTGRLINHRGQMCTVGAILAAAKELGKVGRPKAILDAKKAMIRHVTKGEFIEGWNDVQIGPFAAFRVRRAIRRAAKMEMEAIKN